MDNVTARRDRIRSRAQEIHRDVKALTAAADRERRDLNPGEEAKAQGWLDELRRLQRERDDLDREQRTKEAILELGDAIGLDEQQASSADGGRVAGAVKTAPRSQWASTVAERMGKTASHTGVKALSTGSIDVPAPLANEVVADPHHPRRLVDLLAERQTLAAPADSGMGTGGNTFTYLRQTARDNQARPVYDGATKPTSTFTATEMEDRVRVLAHLSEPFPERYLSDYPALTRFLESEMQAGLLDGLESQILRGDGQVDEETGLDNMTGLEHLSGTVAVGWQGSVLATLRRARREAEMLGETPTAWVMSPADLEQVDMLRDEAGGAGTGSFLVGTGTTAAANVFGGLPRLASHLVVPGTAYLADWTQLRLVVREQARLDADRSGELFQSNQVQLRCEARYGLAWLRSRAFTVINLTAPAT